MENIAVPATNKQWRVKIGLINYYRDMWKQIPGILTPYLV